MKLSAEHRALQPGYEWVFKEPGPRMIVEACKLFGVTEKPGPGSNPEIMEWVGELAAANVIGVSRSIFPNDGIAWCGLAMAVFALRGGKKVPAYPLWAKNFLNFGTPVQVPMLGDVVVYDRILKDPDTGAVIHAGHVNVYVGEDDEAIHGIGGNQSDTINFTRMARSRVVGYRRPKYINTPVNVRPIRLLPTGALSENEG